MKSKRNEIVGMVCGALLAAMGYEAAAESVVAVRPGESLAAAQERARTAPRPVTVELADGLHLLSEKLVFTAADSGVTWAAAAGAKPILSGGVRVTGWKRNADGTWSAAVPKGRFFRQLTVNGRAATRCREPNAGTFFTAGETVKPVGSHTAGEGKHPDLVYDPKDVDFAKIADKSAGEIRLFHWWSDVHLKIGSVNAASNIVTFVIPANKYTGRQYGPDGGKMSRYVLENYRQFLDAPGEWYLDAEAGRIDYLPRPGEKPDAPAFVAVAARLTRLAEIRGAKDLVFRGVGFRDADAKMAARDPINDEQGSACIDAAVVVDGARDCRFDRCAFDLLDGYAVDVVGGSRDVVFSRCSFADLGAGAVRIDGGRFDAAPRTQTRGIVVEDCEIGPYGRDWASGEGVLVKNAASCRIAHNHIHDGFYTGVSLGWSWGYGDSVARDNVVEYNLIEDIGKEMLNDMGGVYTLGLSPGTVIRNNVVRRVRGWSYGGNCIYPDEGSQGILIENNLLCDAPTLIGAHYVRELTVRNNILARQGGREMIGGGVYEPHVSMYVYGNIFYFTNGLPLTSWAVVPAFKSAGWESPWAYPFTVAGRNQYDQELRPNGPKRTDHALGDWNVFWNPNGEDGKAKANAFTGKVNVHSVWADPLFVDAAQGDFRLKPDSPALKMGFEPIDFKSVGPRDADAAPAPSGAAIDPNLSAFISDIHVSGTNQPSIWGVQPTYQNAKFERTVDEILALSPRPARVVVFGDVALWFGQPGDYAASAPGFRRLEAAGIEVFVTTGNHDRREPMFAAFPKQRKLTPVPGRFVSVIDLGTADLLLIDTLDETAEKPGAPNRVGGAMDDAQFAWLEKEAKARKRPFFVGCHHAPNDLKGRKVRALLAEIPNFSGWIHGHDHTWSVDWFMQSYASRRICRMAVLPSTGWWGDIGFALMHTLPDRAELELRISEFYFPGPLAEGETAPAFWDDMVREKRGSRCTFRYGGGAGNAK